MNERYVPLTGSYSVLFTGLNGTGASARHLMDLSARPFGNIPAGNAYNAGAFARRYGPGFHGTDPTVPRFLAVDFETILGLMGVKLAEHLGHTPDIEELHDFVAVNPQQSLAMVGSAWSGGAKPKVPLILSAASPAPGRLVVVWQTSNHDAFRITATVAGQSYQAEVTSTEIGRHSATLSLPADVYGLATVTVASRLGTTYSAESRAKTVMIERGTVEEPPPPPDDDPPPATTRTVADAILDHMRTTGGVYAQPAGNPSSVDWVVFADLLRIAAAMRARS